MAPNRQTRSGDHSVAELQAIRRVLGLAFADDPLLRWIFPDGDHRLELTATWLGLFAEGYMLGGRVDTIKGEDGRILAVALWKIPADAEVEMPDVPGPLKLLGAVLGDVRTTELLRSFATFIEHWPRHPHAYLGLLAVDPEHQRRGLGGQVIRPGIEAASAMGLGVALETNQEYNVAFYRSLGFAVTHEYSMAPDGPTGWSLWRETGALPAQGRVS